MFPKEYEELNELSIAIHRLLDGFIYLIDSIEEPHRGCIIQKMVAYKTALTQLDKAKIALEYGVGLRVVFQHPDHSGGLPGMRSKFATAHYMLSVALAEILEQGVGCSHQVDDFLDRLECVKVLVERWNGFSVKETFITHLCQTGACKRNPNVNKV